MEEIEDGTGDHAELSHLLNLLGLTEERGPGNISNAIHFYKLSLKERKFVENYNPKDVVVSYNNLAMPLARQGREDEAIRLLQEALVIRRKVEWKNYYTALTLHHLSEVHIKVHDLCQAFTDAVQAEEIMDESCQKHDYRLKMKVHLGHLRWAMDQDIERMENSIGPESNDQKQRYLDLKATVSKSRSLSDYFLIVFHLAGVRKETMSDHAHHHLFSSLEHLILFDWAQPDKVHQHMSKIKDILTTYPWVVAECKKPREDVKPVLKRHLDFYDELVDVMDNGKYTEEFERFLSKVTTNCGNCKTAKDYFGEDVWKQHNMNSLYYMQIKMMETSSKQSKGTTVNEAIHEAKESVIVSHDSYHSLGNKDVGNENCNKNKNSEEQYENEIRSLSSCSFPSTLPSLNEAANKGLVELLDSYVVKLCDQFSLTNRLTSAENKPEILKDKIIYAPTDHIEHADLRSMKRNKGPEIKRTEACSENVKVDVSPQVVEIDNKDNGLGIPSKILPQRNVEGELADIIDKYMIRFANMLHTGAGISDGFMGNLLQNEINMSQQAYGAIAMAERQPSITNVMAGRNFASSNSETRHEEHGAEFDNRPESLNKFVSSGTQKRGIGELVDSYTYKIHCALSVGSQYIMFQSETENVKKEKQDYVEANANFLINHHDANSEEHNLSVKEIDEKNNDQYDDSGKHDQKEIPEVEHSLGSLNLCPLPEKLPSFIATRAEGIRELLSDLATDVQKFSVDYSNSIFSKNSNLRDLSIKNSVKPAEASDQDNENLRNEKFQEDTSSIKDSWDSSKGLAIDDFTNVFNTGLPGQPSSVNRFENILVREGPVQKAPGESQSGVSSDIENNERVPAYELN